jgi:hypothetical protein
MEPYEGPYADRFVQAFQVESGQEITAWTERNPTMANDDWQVEAYTDSGGSNGERFILAVATPAGWVGFFAATRADADRIRESMA